MPRALVAGRFCFGLRYACLIASRLAVYSTLVVAILPADLDFEDAAPDLVGESAVGDGRTAREALVRRQDPIIGIEIEDDRGRGGARLFVGQLAVLELKLPAPALLATDPDAPGRIHSFGLFLINCDLQDDEHVRAQGVRGILAQRLHLSEPCSIVHAGA